MRKTLVQCCAALLLAPILVLTLIGTIALATPGSVAADGSPDAGSTPPDTSSNSRQLKVEAIDTDEYTMKFGGEKRLAVKVYTRIGDNGTWRDVTQETHYSWVSSDSKVVYIPIGTVGGIRAVGVGEATVTVTATYGGISENMDFTIEIEDDVHVTITERTAAVSEVYLTAGISKTLGAYVSENGKKQETSGITWNSSDPAVVRVDPSQGPTVTLIPAADITQETEVTITASAPGADPATVTCIVRPNSSIDPDDPNNPGPPPTGDTLPEGNQITGITISNPKPDDPDEAYVMGPGSVTMQMKVTIEYSDKRTETKDVAWDRNGKGTAQFEVQGKTYSVAVSASSDNKEVASVSGNKLTASKPGEAVITARAADGQGGSVEDTLTVMVSGYELNKAVLPLEIVENESIRLEDSKIITCYGGANIGELSCWSDASNIASYMGGSIVGTTPGTATFTVSHTKLGFRGEFEVRVIPDPNATIPPEGETIVIKPDETLSFRYGKLQSGFALQAGGNLSHITGIRVDPTQGTLYYKYNSESSPGSGVGSGIYYYPDRKNGIPAGQRSLEDITFVPKAGYVGPVVIEYTAVSEENKNYNCKILLTVSKTGVVEEDSGITLNTPYNTPVRFNSDDFNRVCREMKGVNLKHVTFSQPSENQGKLYTNYVNEGNYGTLVSTRGQYNLRDLNDIWFVPAPGYSGTVTVYYTGQGVESGAVYSGQVVINVGRENDIAIGGLTYDVTKGGVAHFDDAHFNNYCRNVLDSRHTLSFILFDSLPSESQGVLYYDYRSSISTGSRATTGTSYYYGTRTPRIDRLTFVPAQNFTGTIKIPFTGYATDGTRLSGNVEINVRGGTGAGDINYTCAPGRSVSFRTSDFTRLSQDLTGRTLDYIVVQDLPNRTEWDLYYSNSRIDITGTRYSNSGSYRVSNLSFRASSSFSGAVDIPFEGRSASGAAFNGVIHISSNDSGSTSRGNIRYSTDSKSAAVFDRRDFDDLSQWETDRDMSSVRFTLPSSSQGSLYRGYRSSSDRGTRLTSSSTSITASELSRVAFVPATGFTGTVYIDFTATPTSGSTFTGTVEVEVNRPPADVTVRYSTRSAPVSFYGGDFGGNYSLRSIRFTQMPAASEGYLYFQYASPAHYGRQAGTGVSYQLSGNDLISDLTFVPRAGYTGTVTIPYVGTKSNNSTFDGEVMITVSPTYSSSYFNDMGGYSDAQRAAVDFLYDHNITRGLATGQYGPENSIRRGDFAQMLYQAFELNPSGSSGAFRDVPGGAYYAQAVNTLYDRGIISGIGGGLYAPDSTLTRQDAICMVQRAMRAMGWNASDGYSSTLSGYGDGGSVSGYAQGAMSFAVQRGYLPTAGGRLNPTQALTRVDMAEIIHRVLTY